MKTIKEWAALSEPWQIGEIRVEPVAGAYRLCHHEDAGLPALEEFRSVADARRISSSAADGTFRPLKSAPNLRRGWVLLISDQAALLHVLDYFYPAALALAAAYHATELEVVPLRITLARQSGMYAITRKITSPLAEEMIAGFCNSTRGCLKTILWEIAPGEPVTALPSAKFDPSVAQRGGALPFVPLFCHEACNLLVAQARQVVKAAAPTPPVVGSHEG